MSCDSASRTLAPISDGLAACDAVIAEQVQIAVLERGKPGDVLLADLTGRATRLNGRSPWRRIDKVPSRHRSSRQGRSVQSAQVGGARNGRFLRPVQPKAGGQHPA
ncbi:hypothetical protein [Nonomuraea jiangxiensis]|uniref:hypothetical protein n=1 Tax=Nonomuraea jiangxiensis TaxID=633440 RepID=UPI00115FEE16|nr:hypothetical protein [Nonomuraea jiangxiensis]